MDKVWLEARLVRLDMLLLVFGAIGGVATLAAAFVGYLRWTSGNNLQRLQSAENRESQKVIEAVKRDTAEANDRAAEANRIAESEMRERVMLQASVELTTRF